MLEKTVDRDVVYQYIQHLSLIHIWDYCGTITAGLFIQAFAQGRPWIHLDIAGTAWTDNPLYQGQPQGATAAGTSSLYYLLAGGEETCF